VTARHDGNAACPAGFMALLLAACASSAPHETQERGSSVLDVSVTLLPDDVGRFGGLALRMCPDGAWPRRLVPESRRALAFVISAGDDDGAPVPLDDVGVRTQRLSGCLRLVLDVGAMADRLMDKDLALRVGDDVIVTPDLWLWRPEPFSDDTRLRVHVEPGPFRALLPWGDGVVGPSTYRLKSDAAFGDFDVEELQVGGARLFVARLDDGRAPPGLSRWLEDAAGAVAAVSGRFPLSRVNVLVLPTHVERPVVVGYFSRGGGATALFFVGDGAEHMDDGDLEATGRWALLHELSHALLPPVRREDAWLNEGIATWYQDLLARRAGMIGDDEGYWRELLRGLHTGRARAEEDRMTLERAAASMHRTGAYQHVYWAGVALVLLAEVEAQQHGASVDDLVRALRAAYPDDVQRPARALLQSAPHGNARVAAHALLAAWEQHRHAPWPDVEPTLAALGVIADEGGAVSFDDDRPLAAVRARITAAR
jgi:hypothetical protein